MNRILFVLTFLVIVCVGCGPRIVSLQGEYRYFADSASFHYCAKDRIFPVAFEAEQATVERAYLELRQLPGEWIFCNIEGYFKRAPKVDAKGLEDVLVITRLKGFDRDTGSCSALVQKEGGLAF